MFRRIAFTAMLAGFLGGLFISVVQEFTTTPIILHAEMFESGGAPDGHKHSHATSRNPLLHLAQARDVPPAEPEGWAPADGFERTLYTTMANVIAGVGFALILVGCVAISGRTVDGRTGVLWGIAGFTVFNLATSLGLPPEVPGAMAADLVPRQGWWFLCALATAAGLWLLVFRRGAPWIALGLFLLVLPHVIGAPQPAQIGGKVPPELAGHFVAASLVTAAIFWTVLGWLSGTFWRRFEAKA